MMRMSLLKLCTCKNYNRFTETVPHNVHRVTGPGIFSVCQIINQGQLSVSVSFFEMRYSYTEQPDFYSWSILARDKLSCSFIYDLGLIGRTG